MKTGRSLSELVGLYSPGSKGQAENMTQFCRRGVYSVRLDTKGTKRGGAKNRDATLPIQAAAVA